MITRSEALEYEVAASWWACRLSWPFLQGIAARHFARKVTKKYRRYSESKAVRRRMRGCSAGQGDASWESP